MSLKIQAALLPQKHISFSGSLVGLAGRARAALSGDSLTVEGLLETLARENVGDPPSVEHLVLALSLLYAIRQVEVDSQGRLVVSQ